MYVPSNGVTGDDLESPWMSLLCSSRSMVSGALGKISRLCPLSDGLSDESFQSIELSPLAAAPVTYPSIHHCSFLKCHTSKSIASEWILQVTGNHVHCKSCSILKNAASPTCHPSRLRMNSSDLDPSNTWFYGPTWVSHKTASRSVQPFLHSTPVSSTHRQTDRQTHRPRYVRYL